MIAREIARNFMTSIGIFGRLDDSWRLWAYGGANRGGTGLALKLLDQFFQLEGLGGFDIEAE